MLVNNTIELPDDYIRRVKQFIHKRFIEGIENEAQEYRLKRLTAKEKIDSLISEFEEDLGEKFQPKSKQEINFQVLQEVNGFGPLAELFNDKNISDILINGPDEIWIDRDGQLTKTDITFDDQDHLRRLLDRLISKQGKRLDSQSPSVDTKLSDGSRLHAMIPPLCTHGPVVSIRRFIENKKDVRSLLKSNMLSSAMLEFLSIAIKNGSNIIISGGAAAGKTTLLNALSEFIPDSQRVITIEESSELKLNHNHVISLESRENNGDGIGEFTLKHLLRNALRMRADRIIVGEVRGEEVLDMLQAMNVGHNGSMTTIHANRPEDIFQRLESLALSSKRQLPSRVIQSLIASAINIIIQVTRLDNGMRFVSNINEVVNDNGKLTTRRIFSFTPINHNGKKVMKENYLPPSIIQENPTVQTNAPSRLLNAFTLIHGIEVV